MTDRAEKIAKIRSLPADLRAAVAGLSHEQLNTHYVTGEWTIAQNVHHLADTHMICVRRFKLILTNDSFDFVPYVPDKLAAMPDASEADIEYSLKILDGLHPRWAILMENMTEEQWHKTGKHPRLGDLSLDYLLDFYFQHGYDHIKQIQDVLAAMPA